MARGRRPRVIMVARRSIPRPYHYKQPLTYLFTSWFSQAIMGFTRPLWILLGHYGPAIIGCTSQAIRHRPAWP